MCYIILIYSFDSRPYLDIAGILLTPITTSTVKPPPEPFYAKIIRKAYDILQTGTKNPKISLFRIW